MELSVTALLGTVHRSGLADKLPDWDPTQTPVTWALWSHRAPYLWDVLEHNQVLGDQLRAAHPGDGLDNEVTRFATGLVGRLTDAQVCAVIGEWDGFGQRVEGLDRLSKPGSARAYLDVIAASVFTVLFFALIAEHTDPDAAEQRERWRQFAADHNARHGETQTGV